MFQLKEYHQRCLDELAGCFRGIMAFLIKCQVSEPPTLSLLALAAFGLLRRHCGHRMTTIEKEI